LSVGRRENSESKWSFKRREPCSNNKDKEREKIYFSEEVSSSKGEKQRWLQRKRF
jgi:hypothetical protein